MTLYFDYNATTPVAPEVLEEMLPFLQQAYGNASSIHQLGQQARAAVERARGRVASLIGADPSEIVFTSGGTEADNLAILGTVRASGKEKKHVITSAFEHPAVLYTCKELEREGVAVTYLPVGSEGFIDPDDLRKALRSETVLLTIMHANNELGTIQPIEQVSAIAKEAGVLFHTDAVQTTGKIPLDVKKLGVDFLSLSGHKFYAPKGIGVLYMRRGTKLHPMQFGGHGKHEVRPGTEAVPNIVALGAAAKLAGDILPTEFDRLTTLRNRLEQGILATVEATGLNGPKSLASNGRLLRVPNTSNIFFDYVEGESLVIALDLENIACSTGSACSSGAVEASHVLTAIGLPTARAHASLRFSLGRNTTEQHVDTLLATLPVVVGRLRKLSPLTPPSMAVISVGTR